ncbi:MAG: ATP-dependent DNA helicase [Halobacteriaceae archaeon]
MATGDPEYLTFFPKPTPYDAQREAMERIQAAIAEGRDVLFEGACGTGKTLAALAPALEVARRTDRTVVITTNVHQQMRQFIAEAREIHATEPLRAVVFRGKASMCHIDVGYEECQVLRDATYEVVDAERDRAELQEQAEELLAAAQEGDDEAADRRASIMAELETVEAELEELQERATCEHYYRNLTDHDAVSAFEQWLFDGVRTPDEIYEWAGQRGLCGYELLKDGLEAVDLVICNYHHLLDPVIRDQFLHWLDRDPDEIIAIFDEAHNIEDAARDHAAKHLTERTLTGALAESEEVSDSRAEAAANVLGAFRGALVDVYEGAIDPATVEEDWRDIPVRNRDRRDDLTLAFLERYAGQGIDRDLAEARTLGQELDEQYERAYRDGDADTRRESSILQAATFVSAYLEDGDTLGQYPTVGVRRDAGTNDVYGRAELYTCIPNEVTANLFDQLSASVLMSATLRPFDVTERTLGLENPETMAFGLDFPPENRRTYAVDVPALFSSRRDDPEVQTIVADTLADTVRYTAGNTLAFFPSYGEAERYHELLADRLSCPLYLDEPATRADTIREEFVAEDGAVLCTSLWGTLTEGVSFDGDAARSVAVVGVPYPHLDDRAEAIQEAYDATIDEPDAGWRYAVEIPTIRKTRQALGRVLRAPDEVGVRVLLDRRYTAAGAEELGEYSVYDSFPTDVREELVDIAPEKLRYALHNFFTDHGAWSDDPPSL